MVRTSPSNAGSVDSIPGGKAKIPQASGPKNSNSKQKQYCNKFSKDFKNGSHPKKKKKILQKEKVCLLKYLHKHTFSVQYGNYQITVGLEESHEAVATLLKCCVDTGECAQYLCTGHLQRNIPAPSLSPSMPPPQTRVKLQLSH